MQLSLLTLSLDPETGAFPRSPLDEVEGEVVSVVEHFFHHEGAPRLLLVVHHREELAVRTGRRRLGKEAASARDDLSPEETERFDRLRTWRNSRAEADGVPPYVILSNRQLAEVARRQPATLAELKRIPGVGKSKLSRYGQAILDTLAPEAQADAS